MFTRDLHLKGTTVASALHDLDQTISLARKSREKVICLIVGYGSSGGTHKIKTAIIEELEVKKNKNNIKEYIVGSDLDMFNPKYLNLKFKELIPEDVKRKRNPGEIIVIL